MFASPASILGLSWRFVAAALFASLTACTSAPRTGPSVPWAGRFAHGAVAADHTIASEAGAEMLRRGGNAVDAAVAASFTLSVVRPFSCGIGGGGFMVIVLQGADGAPTRRIAINYRETAPAAITPDFFERQQSPDASTHGGMACGVPGTVAGLLFALERYGSLDRATVLAPAIAAAEEGFVADRAYLDAAEEAAKDLRKHPEWKQRFPLVWKRLLREDRVNVGDRIRLPEQAAALRLIARDGADAFYKGPIARAIVEAVSRDGGPMTPEDLAGYRVIETTPLAMTFLGRTILTMPPPSSGGLAMAQVFGLLERLDVSGVAASGMSPAYVHLVTECFKHAFADRAAWLGDPAFVPGGVPVEMLTSDQYLRKLGARFDPNRTLPPGAYGSRPIESAMLKDAGTSHLCVVDDRGNAVACTETINLEFGSLLGVDEYGFCLNNEMDDFTTRRGTANAFGLIQSDRNLPAPGKRPLSSMNPTVVLDREGRVEMVAGASGGPRIITATALTILNVLVLGMDAAHAVQQPRFHHQWMPDTILLEREWQGRYPEMASSIARIGHRVDWKTALGVVQYVHRIGVSGDLEAVSDPRKGGRPAGP